MATPATAPEFATDAAYPAGAEDWATAATKADPGGTIRARGFEPGTLPAEWLNFVLNVFGAWLAWFRDRLGGSDGTAEWSYETARVREIWLEGRDFVSGRSKLDAGTITGTATIDEQWRPYEITTFGPDTVSATGWSVVNVPGLYAHHPLDLPQGCTLQAAAFYVDKGTSQAVTADQIQVAVVKRPISVDSIALASPAAESVVASGAVGTGTGGGGLTLTSIGEVIDRSLYTYALRVRSSQGADATRDLLSGVRVQYNVTGPRSH